MKNIIYIFSICVIIHTTSKTTFAQIELEYLGLKDSSITSISLYDGIIAVGTDSNGVYWQSEYLISNSGWNYIELKGKSVQTVYAHKSCPLGWAIGAGIAPGKGDSIFIYCSFLGQDFRPLSTGILDSLTTCITELDGFPDPTICGETFAAGGRVLYRRFFIDSVWYPVYTTTHEGNISTVIAKEQYPGIVLAGGAEGFAGILLIKSFDYGENWTNISPIGMINGIDFAGDSAQFIFTTTFDKVFKTTDGGKNWKVIFEKEGRYQLGKILYDFPTSKVFVAGGDAKDISNPILFFSHDDGDYWEQIPLKLEGPIVDMEFGNEGWIYLATLKSGLFRFKQDILNTQNPYDMTPPHTLRLDQNYPNPFNNITKIHYTLPKPDHVTLTIYNVRGQEITQLVNHAQPAGDYSVKWDASQTNSGLYFYKLKTSNLLLIKKMLVIK